MRPARLRRSGDIDLVLRGRRQRAGRLLVAHARSRADHLAPRVAVVASRRVGGAVARNRAKRLLREAARDVTLADGVDLVLIARPSCAESGLVAVRRELRELAARLGVLTGDAGDVPGPRGGTRRHPVTAGGR